MFNFLLTDFGSYPERILLLRLHIHVRRALHIEYEANDCVDSLVPKVSEFGIQTK